LAGLITYAETAKVPLLYRLYRYRTMEYEDMQMYALIKQKRKVLLTICASYGIFVYRKMLFIDVIAF